MLFNELEIGLADKDSPHVPEVRFVISDNKMAVLAEGLAYSAAVAVSGDAIKRQLWLSD